MEELVKLIENSTIATAIIFITISLLLIIVIIIYVIAFIQGREISFWPPKIGIKQSNSKSDEGKNDLKIKTQYKNAIIPLYPNRETLSPLDMKISQAQKEIILYSVQHSFLVHQCLGLLQKKAEAGCKIKILIMAAKDSEGEINSNVLESESHRRYEGLLSQIEASTKSLQVWANSQKNISTQKMIEIRAYQECPVATYLFIDKDESNGFCQIEIMHYGVHAQDMPHYIVYKKNNDQFLKVHFESFEKLWKRSTILFSIKEE